MDTESNDDHRQRVVDRQGSAVLMPTVDQVLIWTAVFVIASSLVGLIATLAGVFHAPQVFLVSLLLTCMYAYRKRASIAELPGRLPRWRHVLLLMLVALIFRVPAYHYVMGGQDEGLYVNIAHHIDKTGGIKVHDRVRQNLEGTPYLQRYDLSNHHGTSYVAGVYKNGNSGSKLQFQFYDVFPVWMALFGGLFGSVAGVCALTFFAVLSIVLFYRIALLLTSSVQLALIAGALIALSPLHAFFSKFPVTEVPTLCFTLTGFLLLTAYWSAPCIARKSAWLVMSVLAFFCAFTTRIDGFMYVPFFIGIGWATLLLDHDAARKKFIHLWTVAVIIGYILSVIYGRVWSGHYAQDIYAASFMPFLGKHWKLILSGLATCLVLAWFALARRSRHSASRSDAREWVAIALAWLPTYVLYAALCLGVLKVYWLGWTDHYQHVSGLNEVWHLAGAGWYGATASSLWTMIVFMGPLMVLAFLAAFAYARLGPKLLFLRWFVAGFFVFVAVLQWVIPYSPYYSRYLLSAFMPYTVLLVIGVWSAIPRNRWRTLLSAAVMLSLVYGGVLSAAQIGKNENEGAYATLADLVSHVSPSDLVLVDASPGSYINQSEIKTPLIYTFHLNAATVSASDIHDSSYMRYLYSRYDNVFLLTTNQGDVPDGFKPVTSRRFKAMTFQWNHSFPHKLVTARNYMLHLYEREIAWTPVDMEVGFGMNGRGVASLRSGWSQPESWGTWSLGSHAIMAVNPANLPRPSGGLELRIQARVLVEPQHPVQNVAVAVNGKHVATYAGKYPDNRLILVIPITGAELASNKAINIAFTLPDAISPAALHLSRDQRVLALGVESAQIVTRRDSAPIPGAGPK